jgi:GNAT superfamily N-acetyltransferase/uncharacterized protein YqeY
VRRATVADVPVLAALNEDVQVPHRSAMPEEYHPFDRQAVAAHLRSVAAERVFWIAEVDGRAVGFVEAEVRSRPDNPFTVPLTVLDVHQIVVAQDARRRGVGRALMAAVESAAPGLGATAVRLEHRAFNTDAHAFYEALGYRVHTLVMRKPVVPLRDRVQSALTAAVAARDRLAVAALRSALAAIANAEALPVATTTAAADPDEAAGMHVAGSVAGLRATEAPRREMGEDEVAAVLRAEVAEHDSAAEQYDRHGQQGAADRLRAQSRVLRALLPDP